MEIQEKMFSKTIIVPSNTYKNINILDINQFDFDIKLNINIYEKAKIKINFNSLVYETKKKIEIIVNHLSDNSQSECNVFGVANNNGKIEFNLIANIIDDSKKNLCKQSINGLLLSNNSSIIGSPNLIINTNSIKAKHSLAIGKINDKRLFYLISKGISKKDAIFLLIMSYFNSSLINIKNENKRMKIEEKIKDKI